MAALERANQTRSERAALKKRLVALRDQPVKLLVEVADLVATPPAWAETMKLYDVLCAMPKWGQVKARKALVHAHCSAVKTLGGLSQRQRGEVLRLLEHEARRR